MRGALAELDGARWNELTRRFGLERGETHALRRILRGLERTGEVVLAGGIYRLAVEGAVEVGTLIERDGGLALEGLGAAIESSIGVRPGDRVEVHVSGAAAPADRARVVRVLDPSPEPVVGRYTRGRRGHYVESLDPRVAGAIDVAEGGHRARDGDIVEVVLLWENRGRYTGRIDGVLEFRDEADRAATSLLRAYRVPVEWPEDCAALGVADRVADAETVGRTDLTAMPLVTIDGEDARDFDDAVYAERRPRGGWRLVVAIADVSHYVAHGSALDREALKRGNSVYLPDRVVPMLPEALSNGICSLRPLERRLAMVCDMQISPGGRVTRYAFTRAVIRSNARLTYTAVARFLDDGTLDASDGVRRALTCLFEVYGALRAQRDARGALDFDAHETALEIEGGRVTRVVPVARNDAHRLIEEAMIAANVCAARFLEEVGPIYRVHEPPEPTRLEQLKALLRFGGIRWGEGKVTPKRLNELLERIKAESSRPAWIFETMLLRALAQARYDPENRGHFGLALEHYTHFTSPIRRYADLTVHRMIAARLGADAGPRLEAAALKEIGAHISMTERRADDVSRAVDAWLKCALVAEHVGETFDGLVVGVTEFGAFVELAPFFVQGLLHVSRLGAEYYHFDPASMTLYAERSGARVALGDALRVEVQDVNVELGRIDLGLAGSIGRRRTPRRRRR